MPSQPLEESELHRENAKTSKRPISETFGLLDALTFDRAESKRSGEILLEHEEVLEIYVKIAVGIEPFAAWAE